jgi:LacI family transcriptional regulator
MHILTRVNGFKQYFLDENISNIHYYELSSDDSDESSTNKVLDDAFKYFSNICGVFVTNSKVYKVAKYLEDNNLRKTRVVGYDLLEENKKHLNSGNIQFLISQKPVEQGFLSIMSLFNHVVIRKKINKMQYMPIDIITKENIEYYKGKNYDQLFI